MRVKIYQRTRCGQGYACITENRHNACLGYVSLRKTSSNGNTRFRTDKIYESLIELVEVSGLTKAFLHNRLGNRQAILTQLSENSFVDLCSHAYISVMQTSEYRNRDEFAWA